MKQIYFLFPIVFVLVTGCSKRDNEFSEWRGPNRQGIFYETGLLKSWPENFTGSRSTPVVAGNLVYLESGMGVVYCMDAFSGDIVWETDLLQEVALVNMDWNMFEIKGRFEVPLGTDQHWAHPVIKDKRMYIRHGDALMVYDISAG